MSPYAGRAARRTTVLSQTRALRRPEARPIGMKGMSCASWLSASGGRGGGGGRLSLFGARQTPPPPPLEGIVYFRGCAFRVDRSAFRAGGSWGIQGRPTRATRKLSQLHMTTIACNSESRKIRRPGTKPHACLARCAKGLRCGLVPLRRIFRGALMQASVAMCHWHRQRFAKDMGH